MELKPLFQNIADAIRQKDGTTEPIPASSFPARIQAIPSGPAVAASPKDVNFFDYDGTLVYSFTLSEAQALTDLPAGPVHDGLVFQGWNWTLEKVKALIRPMNVGAMYITDDGKTRLKIRVWDKARSKVPLYISQTAANGVAIDWGDGSSLETLDGTGYVNTSHQYAETGEYTIALSVADGCTFGFGNGTYSCCVMGDTQNYGLVYCNLLQNAHIGDGVTSIGNSAFRNCYSLSSITIPNGVTSIDGYAFYGCSSLSSITIPNGVTSIGGSALRNCYSLSSITVPDGVTSIDGSAFRTCYSLSSITIPDGVTSIESNAFQTCYSLSSITIPDGVTSIESNAFQTCGGVAEYHLKPITPPTLANANAFEGIASDCIIYVPAGSLEAYRTVENWNVYADYMREEGA